MRLYDDHRDKLLRYCGVSVINVLIGQSILAVCLEVFEMGGVPSQITAAMISAVPAYILSRQWVWKADGRVSFRSEVLPFWIIAIIGLVFSASMIAVVESSTDATIALMATSLMAYGVVWVAKYLFLDKVMWAALHHDTTPAPDAVETL